MSRPSMRSGCASAWHRLMLPRAGSTTGGWLCANAHGPLCPSRCYGPFCVTCYGLGRRAVFRVTGSWGWLCFVLQGLGGGASCVSCYIQSPEDAHFPKKFSPPAVLYADAFVWPLQRQRQRERLRLRIPSWLGIRVPRGFVLRPTWPGPCFVLRPTWPGLCFVLRLCSSAPGAVLRVTASRQAPCYVLQLLVGLCVTCVSCYRFRVS